MILKELINQVEFMDVFAELIELYYIDKNAEEIELLCYSYYSIFNKLREADPLFIEDSVVFYLDVEEVQDWNDKDKHYWEVSGYDKNLSQKYGIDFTPWNQWLGYRIREEQLNNIGKNIYMAHCLWEMTFYGTEEETIQEVANSLKTTIEETKNDVNVSKTFKTLEEFMDELEKEDEETWSEENEN